MWLGKWGLVPAGVGFSISVFLVMDAVFIPPNHFFKNFCTTSITLHPGTIVCDFLWEPALSWSLIHKVWMEQLSGVSIRLYCSHTEEVMVCSIGCSPYHRVQGLHCYAASPLWPYFLPFSPYLLCFPSHLCVPAVPAIFFTWSALPADSHLACPAFHSGFCSNISSQRHFSWPSSLRSLVLFHHLS